MPHPTIPPLETAKSPEIVGGVLPPLSMVLCEFHSGSTLPQLLISEGSTKQRVESEVPKGKKANRVISTGSTSTYIINGKKFTLTSCQKGELRILCDNYNVVNDPEDFDMTAIKKLFILTNDAFSDIETDYRNIMKYINTQNARDASFYNFCILGSYLFGSKDAVEIVLHRVMNKMCYRLSLHCCNKNRPRLTFECTAKHHSRKIACSFHCSFAPKGKYLVLDYFSPLESHCQECFRSVGSLEKTKRKEIYEKTKDVAFQKGLALTKLLKKEGYDRGMRNIYGY